MTIHAPGQRGKKDEKSSIKPSYILFAMRRYKGKG